jgi:erythromycin esterase
VNIAIPGSTELHVRAFSTEGVKRPPKQAIQLAADRPALIADIAARNPVVIGLGEATHGTSEFFTARGALTLDLIRQANVELILFEFDAIAGAALDDYINGADLDIAKAVAALGFWTTDTQEFLRFLEDVRKYNGTSSSKVHIWGIDLQNTTFPIDLLIANASSLSISNEEQTILKVLGPQKGKHVRELSIEQRTKLDSLLSRLSLPRGASRQDLLIAVAARSLVMQMGYWDGDMISTFSARRDAGLASLTNFIVTQTGAKRACLWAHAGHVSKEANLGRMGYQLALIPALRYYGVGFYIYEGSARAWDADSKIGVIPHEFPRAPDYTLEGSLMRATGMPEIAWTPIRHLPPEWLKWLQIPRFVRELGAVYLDTEDTMTLRNLPEAFDAVVVIKRGHDSSPTPTGIRKVAHD